MKLTPVEIIRLAERESLTMEGVIDAGFERMRSAGPAGREAAHIKACTWMKRTMGPGRAAR